MPIAVGPHLYVTRNATLDYQVLTNERFETARLALTRRLLKAADEGFSNRHPDGDELRRFLCESEEPRIRAYTKEEDGLLIVRHVAAV